MLSLHKKKQMFLTTVAIGAIGLLVTIIAINRVIYRAQATSGGEISCNRDATTISEAICLQDMNVRVKKSMVVGQEYQLRDQRDGKSYYVVRSEEDGHVRMTQNLDLDLSSEVTLNSNSTDLHMEAMYSGDKWKEGEVVYWTPGYTTYRLSDGTGTNWNSIENLHWHVASFDPGDYYYQDNGASCNTVIDDLADCSRFDTNPGSIGRHGHVGNYYTWSAAVAENSSDVFNVYNTVPKSSICPAGWRLPTTGFEKYEWDIEEYYIGGGHYLAGGSIVVPTEGEYWMGSFDNNPSHAFSYTSHSDGVSPRDLGMSIRCLDRDTLRYRYDLNYSVDGVSTEIVEMDTRSTHRFSVPEPTKDGYEFLGWTTVDGSSTVEYAVGSQVEVSAEGMGYTYDYCRDNAINDWVDCINVNEKRLYAAWEEASATTYTLTYNAGTTDTVTNLPSAQSCTPIGSSSTCDVTLSTQIPEREGYFFFGWGPYPDMNGGWTDKTISISPDWVAYAEWKERHTYTWTKGSTTDLVIPGAYNGVYGTVLGVGIEYGTEPDEMGSGCFTIDDTNGDLTISAQCLNNYDANDDPAIPKYVLSFRSDPNTGQGRVSNDIADLTIEEAPDPGDGSIDWESGQEYVKGSGDDLVLRIHYPIENFVKLLIDEEEVAADKYTVTSGSTIVTVQSDYLDTLSNGPHELKAVFNDDNVARTTFSVADAGNDEGDSPTPDTDAGSNEGGLPVPDTSTSSTTPDTGMSTKREESNVAITLYILPTIVTFATIGFYVKKRAKAHRKLN